MTDQKLVDELEKALNDEVYDGGMGALSEDQLSELVRTLASTAAKVTEEARTPANNEKLIEEAKHLIEQAGSFREQVGDDASPTSMIGLWLRTADALHAALAEFEKALTPTDDEREALDYLDEMNEAGRIEYDDYRNLHDLISGAVEPAREMFPARRR